MSLDVLAAVETMPQRELCHGDDFVLADYFDYVSTGGIIAAGLAYGMRVDDLRELYDCHGADV